MNALPQELYDFMKRKGAVLTVRGYPGTGKTTFVLSLMHLKKFAYVSSKKNIDDIRRTHPWVDENMVRLMFSIDRKYDYRETDRFDATFYLMPEAIRHALNLFEDGEIEGIIIDSWHTIVEELKIKAMEEREREEIYDAETFFLKVIRLSDYGINFIIAKEGVEDDEIAYLSDGVITMHRKFEEGRTFRWLTIDKMKGIEITKNSYFFTLKDAKFQYMVSHPFRHPKISKITEFPGKKIEEIANIPSIYFDDIFEFRRGSVAVYDFGEYIPKEYKLTPIMGIVANFLKNNHKVIVIPPSELDVEELKYQILVFGIEHYFKNLVFFYPNVDLESYVRKIPFENSDEIRKEIEKELSKAETEGSPLIVLGYDRLNFYLNKEEMMRLLSSLKDLIRKSGGLMLIAGNIWDKEIKRFCSNISEVYVKFANMAGDILMYSIKPWSSLYHLNIMTNGNPQIVKTVIL